MRAQALVGGAQGLRAGRLGAVGGGLAVEPDIAIQEVDPGRGAGLGDVDGGQLARGHLASKGAFAGDRPTRQGDLAAGGRRNVGQDVGAAVGVLDPAPIHEEGRAIPGHERHEDLVAIDPVVVGPVADVEGVIGVGAGRGDMGPLASQR